MSWASENTEAYEALERSAVVRWLRMEEAGFFSGEELQVPHIELVEMLQAEHHEIFQAMMDAGADQLIDYSEAEAFVPIKSKDGVMADMLAHVEGVIGMPIQFVPGD